MYGMKRSPAWSAVLLVAGTALAGCSSVWPFHLYWLKKDPAETKVGAKAPPFALERATGGTVTLASILAGGRAVLVFYRGAW